MATKKEDIMDLLKTQHKYLTPEGTEPMVESETHLKYITHIAVIHSSLPGNVYKLKMAGAVPSANKVLSQFFELYYSNKTFCESLVMYLAKISVCELNSSHNNPIIEEKVNGFIRLMVTYNKTYAFIIQPIWAVLPTDI